MTNLRGEGKKKKKKKNPKQGIQEGGGERVGEWGRQVGRGCLEEVAEYCPPGSGDKQRKRPPEIRGRIPCHNHNPDLRGRPLTAGKGGAGPKAGCCLHSPAKLKDLRQGGQR